MRTILRFARRLRFDVMTALLGIVTSLLVVCPCLPPAASATGHSCCPGDSTLALTAASPDCCADPSLGGKAVATSAVAMPADSGAGLAPLPTAAPAAPRPLAPLPFVSIPPLVLRI